MCGVSLCWWLSGSCAGQVEWMVDTPCGWDVGACEFEQDATWDCHVSSDGYLVVLERGKRCGSVGILWVADALLRLPGSP